MKSWQFVFGVVLAAASSRLLLADAISVTNGTLPNGDSAGDMVQVWMKDQIESAYGDWQETFLRLQKDGGWEEHHHHLRKQLIESMGGLPERH